MACFYCHLLLIHLYFILFIYLSIFVVLESAMIVNWSVGRNIFRLQRMVQKNASNDTPAQNTLNFAILTTGL